MGGWGMLGAIAPFRGREEKLLEGSAGGFLWPRRDFSPRSFLPSEELVAVIIRPFRDLGDHQQQRQQQQLLRIERS
jgi:hypothetical protein